METMEIGATLGLLGTWLIKVLIRLTRLPYKMPGKEIWYLWEAAVM
jgi:hypothetical protein